MGANEFHSKVLKAQGRELASALAADSDLTFAYKLQMEEAMKASKSLVPAVASSYSALAVEKSKKVMRKIDRFEQERRDAKMAEEVMSGLQKNFNRLIHDQVFALEMSNIPEKEWAKTGDDFSKPYGEGTSSASEAYRVYCKGLIREELVGKSNKKIVAGIGIAICDSKDVLVFEMRKPLVSSVLSSTFAEVKAMIEGIETVLMLGIKRVHILCDNALLHQYVTGVSLPTERNLTILVGQVSLLLTKLSYSVISLVLQKEIKFVVELANEAIVSQLNEPTKNSGKNKKKTCLICLEDVDVSKMFPLDGCQHSYCLPCIKQHAEVKLLEGRLPKCPHEKCTIKLKIKKLFDPELYDMLSQRVKEASIPAKDKVYCPNPKCSVLMTKQEAITSYNDVGASKCVKCRLRFCMTCKVLWHNNMNCEDYKKLHTYACAEDEKLDSLATKKLWRQCVMCKSMVELAYGCYHIYCRCGYEFCYTCGAEWKNKRATCKCPIWDERNIIYNHK